LVAGDGNGDGVVTIADVVFIIDQIFRGGPHGLCQDSEDANGDNKINIIDVVYPLDYIFKGGPAPICGTTGT
jgi:hypothetical protein